MKKVTVTGFTVALVLLVAAPAFAHVAAEPSEVSEGEAAAITFRVPNESDSANTNKVSITLPEAAKFEFVSVKPVPGWTHSEERSGDAVTAVTWEGGAIKPGELEEFELSVGPIRGVDKLQFKAVQTYDNGDVVRWIDPVVEGQDAPEHPAPTVTVIKGSGDAASSDPSDDGEDGTDTATFVALALGGVALVAALAALIMGTKRPPA